MSRYMLLCWLCLAVTFASCSASRRAAREKPPAEKEAAGTMRAAEKKALIEKYTAITGIAIEEKHLRLYAFVDKWLGVPYAYGTCSMNGTDCSGFAGEVYRQVYGKEIPRSSSAQYDACERVRESQLQPGDLVFFKLEKNSKASHVGVFLGGKKFIHSTTSKGVMIDDLDMPYYRRGFLGGGRF